MEIIVPSGAAQTVTASVNAAGKVTVVLRSVKRGKYSVKLAYAGNRPRLLVTTSSTTSHRPGGRSRHRTPERAAA